MDCKKGVCGADQIGYIIDNEELMWHLLELYPSKEKAKQRWECCCSYLNEHLKISAETFYQISLTFDRNKVPYYLLDGEILFSCGAERLIFELNWSKSIYRKAKYCIEN